MGKVEKCSCEASSRGLNLDHMVIKVKRKTYNEENIHNSKSVAFFVGVDFGGIMCFYRQRVDDGK